MRTYLPSSITSPARQRGATLLIALIMLASLALLAIFAFNSSTINMRIVGNTQVRQEALASVQTAIESVISNKDSFNTDPAVTLWANPVTVDVDGNGVTDYTVTLTPTPSCYRMRPIPVNSTELDLLTPGSADKKCLPGTQKDYGTDDDTATSGGADSLCAITEWNVRAVATDAATKATVAVDQRVASRVSTIDAKNICK